MFQAWDVLEALGSGVDHHQLLSYTVHSQAASGLGDVPEIVDELKARVCYTPGACNP